MLWLVSCFTFIFNFSSTIFQFNIGSITMINDFFKKGSVRNRSFLSYILHKLVFKNDHE